MRFSLKVAIRFLKSSKGQTILIALGIAIGVSVQIFIGTLIQGLQKSLIDKTIGNTPHITIRSDGEEKTLINWEETIYNVEKNIPKVQKVSVALDAPAFLRFNQKTESILIRGFQLQQADKIYDIISKIYEGKYPVDEKEVIIGKELAQEIGATVGEYIEIITPQGAKKQVKIIGLFDLKVANINKTWVIAELKYAQRLLNYQDQITSIEIQVDEIFKADETANNIERTLGDHTLKVENWKVQNEQLLSGLKGQSISSVMIQVFVLVAVVLGIASVLAVTVIQKSKQIGILKAMGIKNVQASQIFLFEGLILGFIGAILGVALGLLLTFSFSKFAVNADGTPIVEVYIDYKFIILSSCISVASAVIASLIPARKSSKLTPVEVIKNN